MRVDRTGFLRYVLLFVVGLALLVPVTAWSQSTADQAKSAATAEAAARDGQTNAQKLHTLRSVRKLDDHPLFLMKYYGGYAVEVTADSSLAPSAPRGWACSLFAAFGAEGHPLLGRNFDWQDNPAVVLLTDSPDGFASISMVDVSYLGYDSTDPKFDSIDGRNGLLGAPSIPFDGMNEKGLAVGMAAVDGFELPHDSHQPTVGSLGIIRLILDQCGNVDAAIEMFEKYNIDFSGGPQIHYLFADAEGHSALIELSEGRVKVVRNEVLWMAATNFYFCGNEGRASSMCRRYARIEARLKNGRGQLSQADAFHLLGEVAQTNTRWSVVYDMKALTVDVVMSRHFDHPIRISLSDERPKE